jgi:hypothetical protein
MLCIPAPGDDVVLRIHSSCGSSEAHESLVIRQVQEKRQVDGHRHKWLVLLNAFVHENNLVYTEETNKKTSAIRAQRANTYQSAYSLLLAVVFEIRIQRFRCNQLLEILIHDFSIVSDLDRMKFPIFIDLFVFEN